MRKRTNRSEFDFMMPHLFRDDFEEIEGILQSELKVREFEIVMDALRLSSFSELPSNAKTKELTIECSGPYLRLYVSSWRANLIAFEDDISTVGAVSKVARVVSRRERKAVWWFCKFGLLYYLLASLSGSVVIGLLMKRSTQGLSIVIGVLLISVLLSYAAHYWRFSGFSKIDFIRSLDVIGFWKKNRDQIFVGLMIAIFSVFITVIIQSKINGSPGV